MRNVMNDIQMEYWKNLQDFKGDPDNVPDLPLTDSETWATFIIPKLLECGAIPKKSLIVGGKYIGSCRNTSEATWDGTKFIYKRYKWGTNYDEEINHFEDDDGFDLFVPLTYSPT